MILDLERYAVATREVADEAPCRCHDEALLVG